MADETRIDPDGVLRIFTVVQEVGADLDVAVGRVNTVRSTVPAPWGDDEHGERFSAKYEQNSVDTLTGVGDQVGFINTFVTDGREAVYDFQELDERNGQGLAP